MADSDSASSIHHPQHNPSSFHNFDILTHVFSCLDPYNKADRTACVNASRVCRAWNVPASTAIWDARPRWDLLDLYHILLPNPHPLNSAGLVDSAKMKVYLATLFYQGKEPRYDPIAWASFLRCCGRTRALYVPRLETSEALALRLVLKWNEEETLFPSLRSLTWMESPQIGGLLPHLAPPSLRQLKLNFNPRRDILPAEISRILAQLAAASPAIQMMDIENAHQTGPFSGDSLLRHSSIRRLTLGGNMALSLGQLRDVLSLPHLQDLMADLDTNLPVDTVGAPLAQPVVAPNLKKLRSGGTCSALTALFTYLEAPSLRELEVFADEPRWEHHFEGHRDLLQAIARAGNLRFLRYRSFQDSQSLVEHVRLRFKFSQEDWSRFAARTSTRPFCDILRPLFPSNPASHSDSSLGGPCTIERLVFEIWSPTEISSGDFSRVQTAFAGFKGAAQWGQTLASVDPDERRIVYTVRCTFELERA